MNTTSIARTLTLAGFAPAGKLSHAYRGLLPVLALLVATSAGSQTAPSFGGPHRLPILSAELHATKLAADDPAQATISSLRIGPKDSPYAVADGINNAGQVTGYYYDLSSVFHVLCGRRVSPKGWTTQAQRIRSD